MVLNLRIPSFIEACLKGASAPTLSQVTEITQKKRLNLCWTWPVRKGEGLGNFILSNNFRILAIMLFEMAPKTGKMGSKWRS